jgi:hypothetical protein
VRQPSAFLNGEFLSGRQLFFDAGHLTLKVYHTVSKEEMLLSAYDHFMKMAKATVGLIDAAVGLVDPVCKALPDGVNAIARLVNDFHSALLFSLLSGILAKKDKT